MIALILIPILLILVYMLFRVNREYIKYKDYYYHERDKVVQMNVKLGTALRHLNDCANRAPTCFMCGARIEDGVGHTQDCVLYEVSVRGWWK